MASTSSSSSVVSSGPNHTRYDVFLSFRGEDTRNSFTDHLYEALVRAGLWTFRDNDAIGRGEDLKPEIEKAIKASKASIVVLSENYAKSTWCLDELLLILEQRRNFNHFVLPVFYHVDPSDVRKQRQSFAVQVDYGVEGFQTSAKWTEHNVNRWTAALTEVANLTGMVLSGPETNFITDIINRINSKLDLKLVSTTVYLTGMDTRAEDINSWLKNEQSGDEVLTICGMGGSGKTTLAEYIYVSNKEKFESCSFLLEIGKHCEQPHGLLELQKKLLMDILGVMNKTISTVSEGSSKIEVALQRKRVLLVLDDIDKPDQLAALLGTKEFNSESKIIITTRDLKTHTWLESTSWRCRRYSLRLLNDHESLELFSWHAFRSKIPIEGFKELAVQVAQYCEGNPLALKLLGSSLSVGAEALQKGDITVTWKDTLKSFEKDIHSGIQGILRRSFDSLPYTNCKELFLHIACFFIGEDQDDVVKILDPDCCASVGIKILIDRCLLTVSPSNKLMMHQLLRDMGRMIIREESPKDPAKRSRIWCNEDFNDLLKNGKGSETVEGLALNMQVLKEEKRSKSSALKTDLFAKINKLKFLQLKYVQLTGSYKNFPELRWLCWHGFHLKTLHSNLFMRSLVAIEMSYGNLEQFEPPMVLKSLKILNLRDSHKLVSIRNLSRLPNLETLILWNCSSLVDVCKTIGGLESLALLDLTGCKKLGKVSLKKRTYLLEGLKASCIGGESLQQPLFSLPHSLEFLFLNDCNLAYNNHFRVVFSGQSFFYINLGNNLFDFLPNHIDLKALRVLDLTCCRRLKSLLYLPSTLEELYTYCCVSLEKITFQSARFRLREIGYGGCPDLSEIQGLFKLVPIAKLNETDLGHMEWLKAYQNHEVDLIGDEITKGRSRQIQEVKFKVAIHDSSSRTKVMELVSKHGGVEEISLDAKGSMLTVTGDFDPVPMLGRLRKLYHVEIMALGPPR